MAKDKLVLKDPAPKNSPAIDLNPPEGDLPELGDTDSLADLNIPEVSPEVSSDPIKEEPPKAKVSSQGIASSETQESPSSNESLPPDYIIPSVEMNLREYNTLLAKLNTYEAKEKQDQKLDEAVDAISEKYIFFRCQIPNSSFVLSNNQVILFEPDSRVLSRHPTTGKIDSEEIWGQFFTSSPELIAELDLACKKNPMVRRMTPEETHYVVERIRASHKLNQSSSAT